MATIYNHFKKIGFDDSETKMYLELFRNGPQTPSSLSKNIGIHRATIYSIAKKLLAKGVITEEKKSSGVFYSAGSVTDFEKLVKEEERQVKEKYNTVAKISDSLLSDEGKLLVEPKMRRIDGKDVDNFLYTHAKKWNTSAEKADRVWWGYQEEKFTASYLDWVDWLWNKVHLKTRVKLLSNKKIVEPALKEKYQRREVKILSENQFSATTWVIGDYVVHIVPQESGYQLLELEHSVIAENQRAVFKALWERL